MRILKSSNIFQKVVSICSKAVKFEGPAPQFFNFFFPTPFSLIILAARMRSREASSARISKLQHCLHSLGARYLSYRRYALCAIDASCAGCGCIRRTNWKSGGRQVDYGKACIRWFWEEVAGALLLSDPSGSPLHPGDEVISEPWSPCLVDGKIAASC